MKHEKRLVSMIYGRLKQADDDEKYHTRVWNLFLAVDRVQLITIPTNYACHTKRCRICSSG